MYICLSLPEVRETVTIYSFVWFLLTHKLVWSSHVVTSSVYREETCKVRRITNGGLILEVGYPSIERTREAVYVWKV